MLILCQDCDQLAPDASDDGDEICENCLSNRAERAWERFVEAFHSGEIVTLREQQEAARKLK